MKSTNVLMPDYAMFSVDGNEAVHNLLTHMQNQFWDGMKAIKAQHPEVVHPPATEKIWTALKGFYNTNPAELTLLKKESTIGDYVHYREEIKGILHDKSEDCTEAILKLSDGSLKKVKI